MPVGRPPGGPKYGGRKKGTKNKATLQLEAKAGKRGISPLDYALKVMRDSKADKVRRDDMAKAAMPFLHARRAPEDAAGKTVPPMVYVTPNLEEPEPKPVRGPEETEAPNEEVIH